MKRAELEALAHSFGMSAMGAAFDRMLSAGTCVVPPAPERIGRKHTKPRAAYTALVKRGIAETDGIRFRVVVGAEDTER